MHEQPSSAPLSLTGRTVLVTGGNGGIGLGMAAACGRAGAQVVIWGRKADKNDEAVATLTEAGITAHAIVCDVAEPDAVQPAFAASVEAAAGASTPCSPTPAPPAGASRSSTSTSPSGTG